MQSSADTIRLESLRRQVTLVAELPGVYLMKDEHGEVIYVGKAKDLRARVRTYFTGGDGRFQIGYLLSRVVSFETIVTQTEEQAFLLERDLITKYKPRYNIRLKDDRAYLSVRVDENAEWPRIELVRKRADDGARYFGPYAFSSELRNLLEVIKKVVPLRSCADTVLYNRQRPCLEYQIKRCAAPCCGKIEAADYRVLLKQAIGILEGKTSTMIKELSVKMESAATDLRFEEAAAWRDRVEVLQAYQSGYSLVSFRDEDRDVFGLVREGSSAVLCVIHVRGGRLADTKTFSLEDVGVSDEDLLESGIQQFYEGNREIPPEILTPKELENASLLEAGLSTKRGAKVSIHAPQRGSKARLISIAELNARHAFAGSYSNDTGWDTIAQGLASLSRLSQLPRRVECVDISNFQGSEVVGAVVVFFDGVPDKSSYRKYNISQQGKQDDFAAIYEVVYRRLKRGMEEGNLPDLLVIDGGAAQLAKAIEAKDDLRLSVDIISLAKMRTESAVNSTEVLRKPERVYLPYAHDPIELAEAAVVTRFLARLRDEVHRFVITFHRQKRSRRVFQSVMDTVSGVSPEHRNRLIRFYKSVDAIAQGEAEEVAKVGRMPLALARKLLERLRTPHE
jgi:excinuclease ABC subunit C